MLAFCSFCGHNQTAAITNMMMNAARASHNHFKITAVKNSAIASPSNNGVVVSSGIRDSAAGKASRALLASVSRP